MRKIIMLLSAVSFLSASCGSVKKEDTTKKEIPVTETQKISEETKKDVTESGKVVHLTTEQFKELVYNYEENPDKWVYKGTQPCIIDFYADWCRPCKMIAPIMDELAKEYEGKLTIYKVNTENERELAQVFQIQSIPLVVAVPMNGLPEAHMGAYQKPAYKQIAEKLISSSQN